MTAAGSAADALAHARTFSDAVFLEVASAKIRAAQAAHEGAAIAHQITVRSGLPASTSCTASRCACSRGGTISAMRASGRRRWAIAWPRGAEELWPLLASR